MSELRSLISADVEGAWALLLKLVRDASSPDETTLSWTGLRALLEVGDDWVERVAATVVDDRRVAHCAAEALDHEPDLFDEVLGGDLIVETWIRYQAERSDWDFWAVSAVMGGTRRWGADGMWRLIVDLAEHNDDPDVLAMVGIGPVEDFVHDDWEFAIRCIERDALRSERLRQALWSVWELGGDGIPDDLTARIHRASDQPPGTPHRY